MFLTSLIAAPAIAAIPQVETTIIKSSIKPVTNLLTQMNWDVPGSQNIIVGSKVGIGITTLAIAITEELLERGDKVLFIHAGSNPEHLMRFANANPPHISNVRFMKTSHTSTPLVLHSVVDYSAIVWDVGVFDRFDRRLRDHNLDFQRLCVVNGVRVTSFILGLPSHISDFSEFGDRTEPSDFYTATNASSLSSGGRRPNLLNRELFVFKNRYNKPGTIVKFAYSAEEVIRRYSWN